MMDNIISDSFKIVYSFQQEFGLWLLLFSVVFGFLLSFAVGANDSANSWGAPVGAGTVTFGAAVLLGCVMELLGAVLLSSGVVSTVAGQHSVVNIAAYRSENSTEWERYAAGELYLEQERCLMLGMLCAMLASQAWQVGATVLGWPVSGTHAIISSLLGFTLVEKGAAGVNIGDWNPLCASGLYKVIYGLFISSFIALLVGLVLYSLVYRTLSQSKTGARAIICYDACCLAMFTAVGFSLATAKAVNSPLLVESQHCSNPNKSLFGLVTGLGFGLLVTVMFHFLLLPLLLASQSSFKLSLSFLSRCCSRQSKSHHIALQEIETGLEVETRPGEEEPAQVAAVFRPLQLVVASFAALNHGGNDVGNCIGPLVTIWFVYQSPLGWSPGAGGELPWLLWGGFGICLGLLVLGRRVITTVGTKLTPLTPSLGFVSVLSASLVVMLCSLLGIPTSTTHCQVMAVVGAGLGRGALQSGSLKGGLATVDLTVFRNIGLSWLCTIPCSAILSASIYSALRVTIIGPF